MLRRKPTVINVNTPSRTEYVTREVHEHRAPTDASVALLKEMEQAARDKITESIAISGNGFECVVHLMLDLASDAKIAKAVFKLNGKAMTAEAAVQMRDGDNPTLVAERLRDAVAKRIATEVIGVAFAKSWR